MVLELLLHMLLKEFDVLVDLDLPFLGHLDALVVFVSELFLAHFVDFLSILGSSFHLLDVDKLLHILGFVLLPVQVFIVVVRQHVPSDSCLLVDLIVLILNPNGFYLLIVLLLLLLNES